jgi:hypothetical protein
MINKLLFADGLNLNTISSHPLQHTAYLSSNGSVIIVKENTVVTFIKGFSPVEYVDNLKNKMELKEKFVTKVRRMRGFLGQF